MPSLARQVSLPASPYMVVGAGLPFFRPAPTRPAHRLPHRLSRYFRHILPAWWGGEDCYLAEGCLRLAWPLPFLAPGFPLPAFPAWEGFRLPLCFQGARPASGAYPGSCFNYSRVRGASRALSTRAATPAGGIFQNYKAKNGVESRSVLGKVFSTAREPRCYAEKITMKGMVSPSVSRRNPKTAQPRRFAHPRRCPNPGSRPYPSRGYIKVGNRIAKTSLPNTKDKHLFTISRSKELFLPIGRKKRRDFAADGESSSSKI